MNVIVTFINKIYTDKEEMPYFSLQYLFSICFLISNCTLKNSIITRDFTCMNIPHFYAKGSI